jgi:ribosomal protein L32
MPNDNTYQCPTCGGTIRKNRRQTIEQVEAIHKSVCPGGKR